MKETKDGILMEIEKIQNEEKEILNKISELNEKNNSFTISAPTLLTLPETVPVLEGP